MHDQALIARQASALYESAVKLLNEGHTQKALVFLDVVLRMQPESGCALLAKGVALAELDQAAEGLTFIYQSILGPACGLVPRDKFVVALRHVAGKLPVGPGRERAEAWANKIAWDSQEMDALAACIKAK